MFELILESIRADPELNAVDLWGGAMAEEMECMCLACGMSNYVKKSLISLEEVDGIEEKVVGNQYCAQCGGPMIIRGKAGNEPFYKVDT